ncbi:hypothetical protein GYA25_00365 [Candidatus Woesearchaeota archaeon]|nr:hypothetical protein [Candidatus Woesearchaeota archaeon]
MKKELRLLFISTILVLSFLSSLSFASSLENGQCEVMLRTSCTSDIGYIVMGLTNYTNAHGENSTTGSYPYVLCCARGTGDLNCLPANGNKLIGLSSTTNAHAEIKDYSNYIVNVCYEDFDCSNYTEIETCPTEGANPRDIHLLSLSSDTNAHIGNFSEYSTKICCYSNAPKMCYLNKANWSVTKTAEGNKVKLQVYGDDSDGCRDQQVNFTVFKSDDSTTGILSQPTSITFGDNAVAYGEWTTQWISAGIFGGNTKYNFSASITSSPRITMSSSNLLEVTKGTVCDSPGVQTCNEYPDETSCEGDTCNVADYTLSSGGITCGGTIDCNCYWNSSSNSCYGAYINLDNPGDPTNGCNKGFTLCKNSTGGLYCQLGNVCPYQYPACDNDHTCEWNEGCTCSDCTDGTKDTCASGLFCINGKCDNYETSNPGCFISSTIVKACDVEPAGWMTINVKDSCDTENPDGIVKQVLCPTEASLPFYGPLAAVLTLVALVIIYYYLKKKKTKKKVQVKKSKKAKTKKK